MTRALIRVTLVYITTALVSLPGCAVLQRQPVREPVPEQSIPVPSARPERPSLPEPLPPVSKPSEAPPATPPEPPRVSESAPSPSHAVVALLDTAEKRASAGNLDSAAAVLERALRLEPHNPLLWHRLAQLRLQQGQFGQAVNLAVKSNGFAGHDRRLQARNWDIIAQAQAKLGDAEAARAAKEKVRALQ